MCVHVEAALEERVWNSPGVTGIWVARGDIARNCPAREEPDLDEIRGPLCRVYTSIGGVESRAKSQALGVCNLASRISALAWGVDITVWSDQLARELAAVLYGNSCVGVKGHLVCGLCIDAFDYVDLPAVWPGFESV